MLTVIIISTAAAYVCGLVVGFHWKDYVKE